MEVQEKRCVLCQFILLCFGKKIPHKKNVFDIDAGDFPHVDMVIMNPPFGIWSQPNADEKFVCKASGGVETKAMYGLGIAFSVPRNVSYNPRSS